MRIHISFQKSRDKSRNKSKGYAPFDKIRQGIAFIKSIVGVKSVEIKSSDSKHEIKASSESDVILAAIDKQIARNPLIADRLYAHHLHRLMSKNQHEGLISEPDFNYLKIFFARMVNKSFRLNRYKATALHFAATMADSRVLSAYLLFDGLNINALDCNLDSAVWYAVEENRLENVRSLLNHKNLGLKDDYIWSNEVKKTYQKGHHDMSLEIMAAWRRQKPQEFLDFLSYFFPYYNPPQQYYEFLTEEEALKIATIAVNADLRLRPKMCGAAQQ